MCNWKLQFCTSLFIWLILIYPSFSQDFLPKIDQFKSLQKDTNNFYFKEIWIKSIDINRNDPEGFLRRASSKTELGYYKEAISDVNQAIQIDSLNGQCYFLKGYILLKIDSIQAALTNFNKSTSLNEQNSICYYYSAEISMKLGKFKDADSLYQKAIYVDKNFYDAYFGLANLNMMYFKYWQADSLYKKVIEINPDFSLAYYNLAITSLVRDPLLAIKYLNKCIDITPGFAQAYFMRGYIEKERDRISYAYKDWGKAIELEPDNLLYNTSLGFLQIVDKNFEDGFYRIANTIEKTGIKNIFTYFEQSAREKIVNDFISQIATYNLYSINLLTNEKEKIVTALCYFFLGKFKKSEDVYESLLSSASSLGLIHYLRGFNLEYLHQADLALDSYSASVIQSEFPYEAFLRKGIVLNLIGKNEESIFNLKKFINHNDSTRLAYRTLASSYINELKYDSAIFEFNKLIKSDSTEFDIYLDRAYCFKKLEKYHEAINDCSHILDYKPNNLETICFMAECHYSAGDTIGAYNILKKTYKQIHFLPEEGLFMLGSINLFYTKYDSAIVNFNEVLQLNSQHLEALIYRGLCYYCKENYTLAKKDLTSAIALKNDDLTALYTRGLVNLKLNSLNEAYSDLKNAESYGHPLARRVILIYLKDFKPSDDKIVIKK